MNFFPSNPIKYQQYKTRTLRFLGTMSKPIRVSYDGCYYYYYYYYYYY